MAIYGRSCSEILAAILAVLSLKIRDHVGVACLPVSLTEVAGDQERLLVRCGVELVLVEMLQLEVRLRTARVTWSDLVLTFYL